MRQLKGLLSYDGTGYCGWQIQPGQPTIQQALWDAIASVTGESRFPPAASGRTDSGVHALGQVFTFVTQSRLSVRELVKAIGANLPAQIALHRLEDVPTEFDVVRDAIGKWYRYVFHDGPIADVFSRNFCWKVRYRLDERRMGQGAKALLGKHDFRAFETHWPNRATSIRTISRCEVARFSDFVYLDVQADGFLYNMVRAIAGTLYEVGRGKWPVEEVARIVERMDRRQAGQTAPAQGLFLVRVEYDGDFAAKPEKMH